MEVILEVARASYPAIFVPDEFAPPGYIPPRSLPSSEAYSAAGGFEDPFREALARDSDLSQFADPPTEHGLRVNASTGLWWRISPRDLAAELVTYAALRALMTGQQTDLPEPFLAETQNALDELRRLVRGETSTAYALTGFDGFTPPAGRVVPTPWGNLREAREFERAIRAFVPAEATAVLETHIPVTFTIGESGEVPAEPDDVMRRVGEAGGRLPLVLVLATWFSEPSGRVIGDAIWQTTIVPTYPGAQYTGRLRPRPYFPRSAPPKPSVLDDDQMVEIKRWAGIVDTRYHPRTFSATPMGAQR